MTATDLPGDKQTLRRIMQERLRRVSSEERRHAGRAIAELLERSRIWSSISSLAAFASKADEVDSSPLVERARSAGKSVSYPRTTESGDLEFVAIADASELRTGRFGILEPGPEKPCLSLAGHALVLVPGFAFDPHGGRLGRGRGYYDRALANLLLREQRPLLIGIGFAFQIIERVPMTRLDARLDGVVSEEGICECEASRGRWARFGR